MTLKSKSCPRQTGAVVDRHGGDATNHDYATPRTGVVRATRVPPGRKIFKRRAESMGSKSHWIGWIVGKGGSGRDHGSGGGKYEERKRKNAKQFGETGQKRFTASALVK